MAILRYIDDHGHLVTQSLDSEHFVIGRADTCQLFFDSDMISREHLRIDLEPDGRFRARDLGSRNKTLVNGELITETLLATGDIIRVGDRVIEFVDEAPGKDRPELDFLTPDRNEPPNSEWVKVKAPLSLTLVQVEQLAQLYGDQPLTARAEDIANAALGRIVLDLHADRALIALRGEKKTDLRPLAHRALGPTTNVSRTPVSQTFMLTPLLQSVGGRYPQTAGQLNSKLGYAAAGVVAPITYRSEVIGVLYVDCPSTKKPFPSSAIQYCLAAGAHIGAMLGEASRKLARYAPREGLAWMTNIRRLQESLTTTIGSNETFQSDMKRLPGRARCGDFADVIPLDEQRCVVIVIDGGGHGVGGIAQAAAIRSAIRIAATLSEDVVSDPSVLFNTLNQMVASSTSRQVFPCLFVGIDMAIGKLTYINTGAKAPLLMTAPGRLLTMDQPSLVLGVDPEFMYEPTRVDLPETFRLVCCTDGVAEATNGGGEPFSDEKLHEALLDRDAFATVSSVVNKIHQAWSSHLGGTQPDDDALILVVGRN